MAARKSVLYIISIILPLFAVSCLKESHYDNNNEPLPKKDSISLRMINMIHPDSIRSTARWLQDMGTRFALAGNHRPVAMKIRDRFKQTGYNNAFLDSFRITVTWRGNNYTAWQYNVVAELTGAVHPDSLNILGAHYDSNVTTGDPLIKAPGANDNGSGMAAMFEISRVMKKLNYAPELTIQFVAFAAEELGRYGSTDFASKLALSGRPVKMMINNDMIANVSNSNRLLWSVKIIPYSNSGNLTDQATLLCTKFIRLGPVVDTTNYKRSDSYSFFLKGFKEVYFASNSADFFYHTPDDLVGQCNLDYCALIAGLSASMLIYSD